MQIIMHSLLTWKKICNVIVQLNDRDWISPRTPVVEIYFEKGSGSFIRGPGKERIKAKTLLAISQARFCFFIPVPKAKKNGVVRKKQSSLILRSKNHGTFTKFFFASELFSKSRNKTATSNFLSKKFSTLKTSCVTSLLNAYLYRCGRED